MAVVSVMPQPFDGNAPNSWKMRFTSSGADGAPPYPIISRLDRSWFARSGCSSNCHAIVGTPPVTFTRSRAMISIAWTGSHLRMKISVLPAAIAPIIVAEQAVTWNSGITVSITFGIGAVGTSSPRRISIRAPA